MFEHCSKVYSAMHEEAKRVDTAEGGMIVYEGFLTALVTKKLNLSVPYYTSVMRVLKDMGCVRQLRRGGGTAPSQWMLIREPDEASFTQASPKKEKPKPDSPVGDQRFNDLNKRVNYLYSTLGIPEPR